MTYTTIVSLLLVLLQLNCGGSRNTTSTRPTTVAVNQESVATERGITSASTINPNDFDEYLLAYLVEEGINKLRKQKGLNSLSQNDILQQAAATQNSYVQQKEKLVHEQKKGSLKTVSDRVGHHGGSFRLVGENLQLAGFVVYTQGRKSWVEYTSYQDVADEMVKNWVKSKGHYKNLVHQDFKQVGTAVMFNADRSGIYCTQVYASGK